MIDLSGRRAFVTGGSSGIGAAIARLFAARGAEVVFTALDAAEATPFAREIGAKVVELDVTRVDATREAVLESGPFSILVNNVGMDQHAFFTKTTEAEWRTLLAVNLEAVFATTHAALPAMQAAGYGRIVNIASEAARLGSRGGAVYAAAKGGVISFTRSIARENGGKGITANVVTPGPIDTPMLRGAVEKGGQKLLDAMTGATLAGRLGKPDEVAAAVAFLASDEAAYITGECLGVLGRNGVWRMSSSPLDRRIARVKAVLGTWVKGTTVEQQRRDWDELHFSDALPAKEEQVDIGGVPATWFSAPGTRDDRVLLYLHGGGFSLGSMRSHRDLLVRLSQAGNCRVLGLEYRRVPEHRFPAALEDSIAAYDWLLASGVSAASVAFGGDSAGGGLIVGVMVSARDRGVPLPASGVLLSPFTDLTVSRGTYESRAGLDPWHVQANLAIVARAYLKGTGTDPRDPRASPIFADLHGLPPLLVQVGDHEVVLDDSRDFAAAATAAGVSVTLEVHERMIHVFQQFAADVPEAAQAIVTIGTFLDRHWNQAR